jgi:glucuronosyltransferase
MKVFSVLFLLSSIIISTNCLKVLGILPFGSKSHFTIGHSILKTLVDAGHEVTAISPYPLKKPMKNYTDISVEDYIEKFYKSEYENAHYSTFTHTVKLLFFVYR